MENKDEFLKKVPGDKIRSGKFPMVYLIDQCGLKGKKVGGAQISDVHAGFVVNVDNAKASDVLELLLRRQDPVGFSNALI